VQYTTTNKFVYICILGRKLP